MLRCGGSWHGSHSELFTVSETPERGKPPAAAALAHKEFFEEVFVAAVRGSNSIKSQLRGNTSLKCLLKNDPAEA